MNQTTTDRELRVALVGYGQMGREIERCAGTHFDPAVVATFQSLPLEHLEEIKRRSVE